MAAPDPSPLRRRLARTGRKVRRSLDKVLVRAKLSDGCAYRLRIPEVHPDDVFISSYPKSGNTWLRFLIANLRRPEGGVTFRTIESLVADSHKSADSLSLLPRPRFIKTHFPEFDCFPRMVYVYRDVRDALVSWFHFYGGPAEYGDITGFLQSDIPRGTGAAWAQHVTGALAFAQAHPERALVLEYETLLKDPRPYARQVADFCRIEATDADVQRAVERSSFRSLRQNEQAHGGEFEDDQRPFFRAGRSAGWRDVLSDTDLAAMDPRAASLLARLGYEPD